MNLNCLRSNFYMTVVDNLTSLITTLGNGGFVGLVALLILWNILTKK